MEDAVSRLYVWLYWLMNKATGRPVVLMRRGLEESLRLVRYRLRFGARRPVIITWSGGWIAVLLPEGKTKGDILNATWQPFFGRVKPSIIGSDTWDKPV